jgi:GT2 family glycosyltransferase
MDKPFVSFLIITRNRKDDLTKAIFSVLRQNYQNFEIIVVDNNSYDKTYQLFEEIFCLDEIKYIKLKENRGVSGARNIAIQRAKGDILITLDDDAEFLEKKSIVKIVDKIRKDKATGVLTFQVINKDKEITAFPFRDRRRNPNIEGETCWFIGVAHAIPKSVYNQIGLYKDFFPYGHEELDLSLRILDKGYKIIYFPEVQVLHKTEINRKKKHKGRWRIILRHRIKVALLNLPMLYVLSTTFIWSLRVFIDTYGNIKNIIEAYLDLYNDRVKIKLHRKILKRNTLKKIKKLKGPLYY